MELLYIVIALLAIVAGYAYTVLAPSKRVGSSAAHERPHVVINGTRNGHATPTSSSQPVTILFGSQTGTAEMFAKTIFREGHNLGIPVRLCDVEDYDVNDLEQERLVILVCATYGEGEPTDTMKSFHEWIMDDARAVDEELTTVKYTIFGLGDRQYKYFCEEAVVMDRRFSELGAQRIYGVCLGNSGGGQLEEEFDEWRRDLWPALSRSLQLTLRASTNEPIEPECRMKMWDAESAAPGMLPYPKTASVLEPTQRLPVWVSVTRNADLLKRCPDRCIRSIDLDISDTIVSYQAGDHLGILPHNPDALVQAYLDILCVSEAGAAEVFSLQDKKTLKNVFPARVSVRTALKWYMDLAGPPKKSTLRAFAHLCSDGKQKEEFLQLLSVGPEAQRAFTAVCAELRTVLGFLRRFDSCVVPLGLFLELMPRMTPRYFSISSDLLQTPSQVSITVAVVPGGLCTHMLQEVLVGERIPVFVRKSKFHLPLRDKTRPIIMIGPGTGVAPFIGFLQRRRAWQKKQVALGRAIMFFGCRHHDRDYIYEDTFVDALQNGVLSSLFVAHSRDGPEKVYVQHLIRQQRKLVWDLMTHENANMYICGDAKHMACDVEKELVQMAQELGNMSVDGAKQYLVTLEKNERLLKDVWSSSV